ncbi:IclR family transcriptional regulator [Streptomyces winkii]|uniref:IclR family transcriptional regulator n=1 Tax=Streptomyces winkii TaxID=3051178 RepID=UPI0028D44529|nr:IclR family transcriptional regulator [Streptomyces sp. DSM 40971]
MPRTRQPGRTVSSRLLEILFAFRPGQAELSLSDLTGITGIPHPSVRRLALELVEAGALERREDGTFTVGLRLWQLGTLAPLTESLRTLAQPFMEDLHSALHQHVQLAVLEGHEAVIIERLSAPGALGLVSQVGGRLPLHCSGVGKVLLSHGGPELIESVLNGGLRRYTPRTVVDPVVLRNEIAACRRTGTAGVRGELTGEADSVATRVVDGRGRVVAALSVVLRSGSVKQRAALPSVLASGLGISRQLGWRPGTRVRAG